MRRTTPLSVALLTFAALAACGGGGGSNPTPVATPTPVPTPTATPTPTSGLPAGLSCDPTPPPLYGIQVKVLFDSGQQRRTLDSRPRVINMNGYCGLAGFGATDKFCWTRREDDPQAVGCDYLAMGRAGDTGRWGPTWFYEGKPCVAAAGEVGCSNHPDNQFLVNTRGDGTYEACAAPNIPLSEDPDRPGSRCGRCTIQGGGDCR